MERIEIPFGKNKIVAEVMDVDPHEFPKEIFISIFDDNDMFVQDIALIRPYYDYDGCQGDRISDKQIDVMLWLDKNTDDISNRFVIDMVEEDSK